MEAEIVEALRLMRRSAEAHEQAHREPSEKEPPFCTDTRTHLVAYLMVELGLDLEDLGHIATAYLDLCCEMEGKPESEQEEEWPDKIGG